MIHHNSENANVHMALRYLFDKSIKHAKPVYEESIKISIRFDRIYSHQCPYSFFLQSKLNSITQLRIGNNAINKSTINHNEVRVAMIFIKA